MRQTGAQSPVGPVLPLGCPTRPNLAHATLCQTRMMRCQDHSADARLRVALDATPLFGLMTGVGAFCFGVLSALAEHPGIDVTAFAVSWRRRNALGPLLPPGVRHSQRPMPAKPLYRAWADFPGPPIEWFAGHLDVVHGTKFVVPPTRRAGRVVTVHDLTVVRYPEMCDSPSLRFPRLVRRAVATGAWVHTPSRFVAEEVVSEFGIDPARVRAIHHGIPSFLASDGGSEANTELMVRLPRGATRYVLAIGTVEPRKDYPLLVRSFDRLVEQSGQELSDVALVIAGDELWGKPDLDAALETVRRPDRIVRLGYVGATRLASLLCAASAVAYPSVYEGFGFVPLEAMAAGVPVVATAAGAIPEVCGDAALLVPPGDADALAGGLAAVLTSEDVWSGLIARGRRQAEKFSWASCAAGLSELYAEAAP